MGDQIVQPDKSADFDITGDLVSEFLFHISHVKTLLLAPVMKDASVSLDDNYMYSIRGPNGDYNMRVMPIGYCKIIGGGKTDTDVDTDAEADGDHQTLLFNKIAWKKNEIVADTDSEFVEKLITFPHISLPAQCLDILLGAYIVAYKLQGVVTLSLENEQHLFGVLNMEPEIKIIGDDLTE